MKSTLRLALAALILLPAALIAAPFEGKVGFKLTNGGKSQDITYAIKGSKFRIDMAGVGASSIVDLSKKEMTAIMTEQRMYMTMAMPEGKEAAGGKAEDVKIEKTSETATILGQLATKYLATAKSGVTEMWLAEGLGMFAAMTGNPMAGGKGAPSQPWASALAGKELFPLRVVTKDKSGKENFRMEATSLNKQSVPDSEFAPPADYQKFDMGGMMKGMMPGMGR